MRSKRAKQQRRSERPPMQTPSGKPAPAEPWRMPSWMEAFRPCFRLVDPLEIEHRMNQATDQHKTIDDALMQVATEVQVSLLTELQRRGLLLVEVEVPARKGSDLL